MEAIVAPASYFKISGVGRFCPPGDIDQETFPGFLGIRVIYLTVPASDLPLWLTLGTSYHGFVVTDQEEAYDNICTPRFQNDIVSCRWSCDIGIRLHSLGLDMHMIPHLEGTAAWRTPVCQAFDVDQPN